MSDLIRRKDVFEAVYSALRTPISEKDLFCDSMSLAVVMVNEIPTAIPNNQIHLCEYCKYDYPECPAEKDDVIFGNDTGHDNICACAKFEIKPERIATETEQTAKVVHSTTFGEWKNMCGHCFAKGRKMGLIPGQNYCYECGCKLDWSDDDET